MARSLSEEERLQVELATLASIESHNRHVRYNEIQEMLSGDSDDDKKVGRIEVSSEVKKILFSQRGKLLKHFGSLYVMM